MDELSKQLIGEIRTPVPAKPGQPERYDSEYVRNGTANIFCAIEPLNGEKTVSVTERRTKTDWARFMRTLVDERYPDAEKIVLVADNLNTHTPACFYEAFPPEEARRLAEKNRIPPYPKARQLAQHGREGTQRPFPAVPAKKDAGYEDAPKGNLGLDGSGQKKTGADRNTFTS
jgi:hypothetical protein